MLSKSIIGLAALISGGFVTVDSMVGSTKDTRAAVIAVTRSDAPASVDYQALNAQARAALGTLREREKDLARQRAEDGAAARPVCPEQTWPYYSSDCLVAKAGEARQVVRVVRSDIRPEAPRSVSF